MASNLVTNEIRNYNTIYVEGDQIKGKNTNEGEQVLLKTGKPLLEATQEQVISLIEKNALSFSSSMNTVKFNQHCKRVKAIVQEVAQSTGVEADFESLNLKMVQKYDELVSRRKGGRLTSDIRKNLKVSSAKHFIAPLTKKEEAFIKEYLERSPLYQKWRAQYELLQKATDRLPQNPMGQLSHVEIDGKTYSLYDVDNAEYLFFGCSGKFSDVIDDYAGYGANKWSFLCISLLDENHPYFHEEQNQVFQILSVPPEAIIFTHHTDAYTPESQISRDEWVPCVKRYMVLADRVMTAHNAMKEMARQTKTDLPLSSNYDTKLRLQTHLATIANHLVSKIKKVDPKYIQLIARAAGLLQRGTINKDFLDKIIPELEKSGILKSKDITELREVATKYMTTHTTRGTEKLGRVDFALHELITHFSNLALTREERKEIFIKLFQEDDPTQRYDIVRELKTLDQIVKTVPKTISMWINQTNRLLGPSELAAQTSLNEYNEINIDTNLGKVAVKGWLIPNSALKDTAAIKPYLEKAEQEGIPVFIRSSNKYISIIG